MTEDQSLLHAVLSDPEDDTVRLAYADWLLENQETVECAACKGTGWVESENPFEAKGGPERLSQGAGLMVGWQGRRPQKSQTAGASHCGRFTQRRKIYLRYQ